VARTPNPPAALWPLINRVFGMHTAVYRATRGLVGHRLPFVPPMLLLDHVGAKSGTRRTTPLVYLQDGERFVIVASKGGFERHPAWFHNLKANPDTTIQVGSRTIQVRARVATAAEHRRLWPRMVDIWSDYDEYQKRTARKIPLVLLEPPPS
jgi:deazaflavin-dependent oxidoreductase (nitroreductase family)